MYIGERVGKGGYTCRAQLDFGEHYVVVLSAPVEVRGGGLPAFWPSRVN